MIVLGCNIHNFCMIIRYKYVSCLHDHLAILWFSIQCIKKKKMFNNHVTNLNGIYKFVYLYFIKWISYMKIIAYMLSKIILLFGDINADTVEII